MLIENNTTWIIKISVKESKNSTRNIHINFVYVYVYIYTK